jgi:hypothetical protein
MFTRRSTPDHEEGRHEHEDGRHDHEEGRHVQEEAFDGEAAAHERFGGVNTGAAFFGWLVAVALAILLTGIIGAVVAGFSATTNITQDDAERSANEIGLAAAIVLVVVLGLAYYAGGYVAGRMSRFDGGRQGLAVWGIGLVITLIAIAVGVVFGDQYNFLDRVDLPRLPIPTEEATAGGLLTALVLLVLTALAAAVGGKAGHRYHRRVDAAHLPE